MEYDGAMPAVVEAVGSACADHIEAIVGGPRPP